jgi:hypothetical protein
MQIFMHFSGIMLWGGNNKTKSIFKLQKWVMQIISSVSKQASCRHIFKDLNTPILPVACIYVHS